MTVAEMLSYLRRMHNEENALSPNWSDSELYALIQAKSNEVTSFIGIIEGKTTTTSTSGTADVSYPTDYIKIRRVWYSGVPLKYLNFRQFEARIPSGTAPSGTPREFTLWNDTITLVPTPDTSSDTITIYGEKKQGTITAGTTLSIPSLFHGAICDGILSDMFAKDLNGAMARFYQEKWLQFHIPNMQKYALSRRRRSSNSVVIDSDSVLETEFGII